MTLAGALSRQPSPVPDAQERAYRKAVCHDGISRLYPDSCQL